MEICRKLNEACNSAFEEVLSQSGERVEILDLSKVLFKENGKLITGGLSLGIKLNTTGIYILESPTGELVYVGQGGKQKSTPLNDRILQELRLYTKSPKGSNGGTISKNIQQIDNIKFESKEQWRLFISSYKLKILHSESWEVSINLIEAFIMEAIKPKYNINK
ncbi:hypothetical protein [Photobacterium carnosum]|uniref:GIY-YIG domain-containing protein n=1 Tax=Photobacterium carnosum TaxID=2023717 RepID=A0A2N4UNM6_9GAMM|nr:hypothetical protein [Photobacterium carnosum]MCD9554729.1 hypothetical protein [Photobacterium carnosum]PLC56619.1 hypothetical protein CIK00_17515 [Photobacterium carnosum]